ncbi:MAG: RIP metalloprotease RseP [Opitutaceae bacterium]
MAADLLPFLLSNVWSIFLIVLFFGGSIFVHELGHYLAARARGVHVEVFSIGFGPPIFSWKASDGTRYQIAWFPLGGYVLLPQIADLGPVEGESTVDAADLPPVTYGTKVLVFVAGASFNILFAFMLACIVWRVGQPENNESESTQIGYVTRTIDLADGSKAVSPALEGGLKVGDTIKAIDGSPVANWDDINETLSMGSGRDASGARNAVFSIVRNGVPMEITVHPRLSGDERWRRVGIMPGYDLNVHSVEPNSAAAKAGLEPGDRIVDIDGSPIMNANGLGDELALDPSAPAHLGVIRNGRTLDLVIPPRTASLQMGDIEFSAGYHMTHPSPFEQIAQPFVMTLRTVWGLVNPRSDIGLSKVSGPVGIVHIFHAAAEAGIRAVLRITILINVNLAILNLLPVPVLDGGQIVFATIGKLRGRALPPNFIMTAQSVFMVLLLSMVVYISFFDVRRWSRDARESHALAPAAAAPAKP